MKNYFFITFICLSIFLEILFANNVYAISDQEYARAKKVSPEFKQAEEDLNSIWNELISLIKNKDIKNQLLANQRKWLKERDEKNINTEGIANISNFTLDTKARIAELYLYKKYVQNNFLPIKITGQVIAQTEQRYADDVAYFLYSEIDYNKKQYLSYILLCSTEDKEIHKNEAKILKKSLDGKDKCAILVDYDLLGEIQPIAFVNSSKNEKCSLHW